MPIYEYQCQDCGYRLEILHKVDEVPQQTCPQCQQASLHKLVSAPRFQLKGTGWYVTDFKDNKAKAAPTATTETSSD